MKIVIVISFMFWSLILKAQEDKKHLENNTFISKVGSMCEETNRPSRCAGKEIYLILTFFKEKVVVSERYISGCNEIEIFEIGYFKWVLSEQNEIKIDYNPDTIFTKAEFNPSIYMNDFTFKLIDTKLIGEMKMYNKMTKFFFKKTSVKTI
ncbi:hypothetical protein [Tenacibaculum piscium]|uniref:hypothetical protein n=1 Tax=Tenacibaculum piscium TaxID=1458515 RepID=UPI001F24B802|nr:hypothetical protein [Tenacibaculum piscium]MCG8182464.1 hypothetical protein [Tenacibaculum piscium]MCG8203856.1 hypothetical protein [Tenacibaculum piscium]